MEARVTAAAALTAEERTAWDSMCRVDPAFRSPFLSPHFTAAVAASRPDVFVCLIEAGGLGRAFLPFQFRNAAAKLMGSAERAGGDMSDHFGLVAPPELRTDGREILRLSGIQHFYFTHLGEEQRLFGLTGEQADVGLAVRLCDHEDYWAHLASANKAMTGKTDRLERQLERSCGTLRFEFDNPDREAELEQLIRHKSAQYLRTGRRDLFAAGWTARLLRRLASEKEATCSGTLSTLYAGDTWVASHFGLRSQTVLHHWFPVYNWDLGHFGPGRLLDKRIVRHARECGIALYDFGAGDSRAKRDFCPAEYRLYRGEWRRFGLRSFLSRAERSVGWRLEMRRAGGERG